MSATCSIVREQGLVHLTLEGRLTDADLLAVQARMRGDEGFRPDFRQIVDATSLSEVAVTPEGLCAVAACAAWGAGSRRAMVAPSDVARAMGRMYQKLREGGPDRVAVFTDLGEALAWLGLPALPSPADSPALSGSGV
jgi:hypothetical protein